MSAMRASASLGAVTLGALVFVACKPKETPREAEATAAPSAAASAPQGDAPLVPDEVPFGALPTWPAPPPRFDGGPVTLRAASDNGRVGVWGHGTAAGAKGLYMRVRLYQGDVIVHETSIGGPYAQQEGSWYPVTSNVVHGAKDTKFDRVAAQVDVIQGEGPQKLWKAPEAYGSGMDWRYPMPSKPAVEAVGTPIGFAPITLERERTKPDDKIETTFVGAIYNGGAAPLSRVEFTVTPADAKGTIAELRGLWLGMSGGMTAIPPKTWARVDLGFEGDPERLQKATTYALTVAKTEPSP